ncbi:RNA polymerase sigma factor [Paraglaciecola aquimarina]|uniref:RNA polymerase sigma factor n=1 Tax=Paraglaciecola algarum TaxID=3050085 RepID=A0ABS9D4J3_9ALTE|nr:RNA polymerase sigma factor [Paraglaciecola sp. G1-23]MCF2946927.1 RNA polymerase sigma factor [Paraglaciecola sp. G1-23]
MKDQAEEDLLVMAAQQGNQQAFSLLFQRHQQALVRFAFKLSNDREIAKEATQEAWIKSTKTILKLRDPRAFKSWLYRLTRWQTIDLIRQSMGRHKLIDPNIEQDDMDCIPDDKQLNEDKDQDQAMSIMEAIDKLPGIEKHMIHLFYLDDMTVAEVSVVLEIPVGTVKSRLNRARQLLKQKCGSV